MTIERSLAILVLEGDRSWESALRKMLRGMPGLSELAHCNTLREALVLLGRREFDLVLLNLNLSDSLGLATFSKVQDAFPRPAIVVLTEVAGEEMGVAAVRMGADDYLTRSEVQPPLLRRMIRYAVERHHLRLLLEQARMDRSVPSVEHLVHLVVRHHPDEAGHSLQEKFPKEFGQFVECYRSLLTQCLEEQIYQTAKVVAIKIREMAEELGKLRGGPRDVLELHMAASKEAMRSEPADRRQAVLDEGRILMLNLMGHLVAFYREYFPAMEIRKN